VILVLNDGVEVEVHAVGDEETEPLHGEIPVLELVVLGDSVVLGESIVGVRHSIAIVEESDDLDDVNGDEADHVGVMHNSTPDNEEPDDTVVVGSNGEDPDDSGRYPHGEHEDGIDILGETPHGVGVHCDNIGAGGSVFTGRSIPELVVVVLEPEEGEGDGGSSEHGVSSELPLVPSLHSVSGIESRGLRVNDTIVSVYDTFLSLTQSGLQLCLHYLCE